MAGGQWRLVWMRRGARRFRRSAGPLLLALAVAFGAGAVWGPPADAAVVDSVRSGGEWQADMSASHSDAGWSHALEGKLAVELHMRGEVSNLPWRSHARVRNRMAIGIDPPSPAESDTQVERLSLSVYLPQADVTLGRQPISWGVGQVWSPADLFGSQKPLDFDSASVGRDGVAVRIPAGPLDYWSVVAAEVDPVDPAGDSLWRYGIRRRGHMGRTDWALLAAFDDSKTHFGSEFKGDLALSDRTIGWHAETVVETAHGTNDPRWTWVLGADAGWLDGRLIWMGEYLRYGYGAPQKSEYDFAAWLSGAISHPATDYLAHALSYRLDDFTTLSAAVLANLVDRSTLWNLGLSTDLGGAWTLDAQAQAMAGSDGGEFAPGPIGGLPQAGVRPDFGAVVRITHRF